MFAFVLSLGKKRCFLLLPLLLLCGCSSPVGTGPITSPTATAAVKQVSTLATVAANQAPSLATAAAQVVFTSYVGKWEVHDSLLTINADYTGVEQWNAGPCSSTMCSGEAHVTFVVNTDGSLNGNVQSVNYVQGNGDPAPAGFQPDSADDPHAGDMFQLKHSDVHLLYTTWLGSRTDLNQNNRYWCDDYALKAGWKQCGA